MRAWRKRWFVMLALSALWLPVLTADAGGHSAPATGSRGLRDVTVLIVRHAEKPRHGRGLSQQGKWRARLYADYFDPLQLDGATLQPQRLIAAGNSGASERSLLTLKPLANRLHLQVEQPYSKNQVDKLANWLRQRNNAAIVLIAWHHGSASKLIDAFGQHSEKLPRKWPPNVYNWLVVLHFNARGELDESHSEVVQEHVLPDDA